MTSGIYAIVNMNNGKMYIGRSVDMAKRWTYHQWMLNANRHFNPHLQRAWAIGDKFEFRVIEECDKDALNDREIYWIAHYKTMDDKHGYNLCEGGGTTTGFKFSEETKKKWSEQRKGVRPSKETIEKRKATVRRKLAENPEIRTRMREAARERMLKRGSPWNKGRRASQETRKKLSESLKGKAKPESQKQKLRVRYSGEGSLTAKLKERDVVHIRLRFLSGERQCDIHKDYPQVTPQTLYDIVRYRRWKSVPNTIEELKKMEKAYGTEIL